MFVNYLDDDSVEVLNPTWKQIRSAIQQLDGLRREFVSLHRRHPGSRDAAAYMFFACALVGYRGERIIPPRLKRLFSCSAALDGVSCVNLVDLSKDEEAELELWRGADDGLGLWSEQWFIDLRTAERVAKVFSLHGELEVTNNADGIVWQ